MKIRTCEGCGSEVQREYFRPGRVYCTQRCYQRNHAPRSIRSDKGTRRSPYVTLPCVTCGKLVERRASEARNKVFCDLKCFGLSPHAKRGGRPRGISISRDGKKRMDLAVGTTKVTSEGYVHVWLGRGVGPYNGWHALHRYKMEQKLGRPLLREEQVHHKNKNKQDNRLSNLELWNGSQPTGARVEDLVAYATGILKLYAPHKLRQRPRRVNMP